MAGITHPSSASSLADILERVLDKGIVVAGDISISLVGVELLTIRIRLLVSSVERAQAMGINWWQTDPSLSSHAQALEAENEALRERLQRLERQMARLTAEADGKETQDGGTP